MDRGVNGTRAAGRPFGCVVVLLVLFGGTAAPLTAQQRTAFVTGREARQGSEFLVPLGSIALPGLGQYIEGAPLAGLALTATAAAGIAMAAQDDGRDAGGALPREARDQLRFQGVQVYQTAGSLSAWDAFHRAVPALQEQGKYEFLGDRDSLGDLLTAPFDPRFLRRPTTWAHLAFTGLVAGIFVRTRRSDAGYAPFHNHDAAFLTAVSFNAGVGEEALFRGWMLPMLYQKSGERFWLSNAVQAGVFGGLHVANAREFAAVITGWAMYEGWLTRRNDWGIRESIFHHFWYDIAVITATFLTDERPGVVQITFPTIRF